MMLSQSLSALPRETYTLPAGGNSVPVHRSAYTGLNVCIWKILDIEVHLCMPGV